MALLLVSPRPNGMCSPVTGPPTSETDPTATTTSLCPSIGRVPPHAKLLVVSGGEGSWRRELSRRGGEAGAALVATWELRTSLGEQESKQWACEAAVSHKTKPSVFVVFFHDGSIGGESAAWCRPRGSNLRRPSTTFDTNAP